MKRTIVRLLLFPIAAWLGVMLTGAAAQAPEPTLVQILSNQAVFGKEFAAALRSLPAWNALEEREVVVFAHQIVGSTPYDTKQAAEKRAVQLNRTLTKAQAQFKSEFSAMSVATPRSLRAEGIPFPEDDSYRAAVTDSSLQLLNPELTLARLSAALGKPQSVRYVTVQNKLERRPIQLTLYEYAGGQIAFAVPDPSLRRGIVDRALLNVRAVNSAVFQETK
jgi:hypothetical protein